MVKTATDAVQILRYFETEPLERAEVVFAIVSEKMRERLSGRQEAAAGTSESDRPARKHRAESNRKSLSDPIPAEPGA